MLCYLSGSSARPQLSKNETWPLLSQTLLTYLEQRRANMNRQDNERASTHSVDKDLEKVDYIEVSHNKYANLGLTAEETDFYENYPEDKRKKMIRKVDVRLVPVLALLYLLAHIDRANIGNAKVSFLG